MKPTVIISVFLLIVSNVFSQEYIWNNIDIENQSPIYQFEIDTLGFIWMMNDDELFRFNGSELETIDCYINKNTQVKLSAINQTNSGQLLISYEDGSIFHMNPMNVKCELIWEADSIPSSQTIVLPEKNIVIKNSYGNGMFIKQQGKITKLSKNNLLNSNEIYECKMIGDTLIYVSDKGLGKIIITDNSIEKIDVPEYEFSDIILTNIDIGNNQMWISDYNRNINELKHNQNIRTYVLPKSAIINDLLNNQNSLFIGTENGFYRLLDGELKALLEGQSILDIEYDQYGNLWLLNDKNQLIYSNISFDLLMTGLSNVQALESVEGNLWVGTEQYLYKGEGRAKEVMLQNNITTIEEINDAVLIGTYNSGLFLLSKEGDIQQKIPSWNDLGQVESILDIYKDQEHIYVSSLNGVHRFTFEEGKIEYLDNLDEIIKYNYVYVISGNEEFIGFGLDKNGLILLNKASGEYQNITLYQDSLSIGSVYSIEFVNDQLWFTSKNIGLLKWDKDQIDVVYDYTDKSEYYTSLVNLNDKELLFIKSRGIDLYDLENRSMVSLDEEIGLIAKESHLNVADVHDGNACFEHDGNIMRYEAHSYNRENPKLILKDLNVNLSSCMGIHEFKQDENNLQFFIDAAWLTSPEKISFSYNLDGLQPNWKNTNNRTITFPRLNPGDYVFRAKLSGTMANDSSVITYPFTIKKYFYNTWWFGLLIIVASLGIIWLWRSYIERQKKVRYELDKKNIETQLLTMKNQLSPHFLFNSLNTLVALIEEKPEQGSKFAELLTDYYRDILELGKFDTIPLEKERQLLEKYIQILKVRFRNNLNFTIDIDCKGDFEIPPLALQLLVENAVKHNAVSSRKPLQVDVIQKDEIITIENNINKKISSVPSSGVGLINITKRFELNGFKKPLITKDEKYFQVKLILKKSN